MRSHILLPNPVYSDTRYEKFFIIMFTVFQKPNLLQLVYLYKIIEIHWANQ